METLIDSSAVAAILHEAEQKHTAPLAPLSETYPSLTTAQAYAIQSAWLEIKRQGNVHLVGHKIGLTSLAMQKQLGVDQPDYGFLLNTMVVPSGSTLAYSAFIAPRIEPEIGFWLACCRIICCSSCGRFRHDRVPLLTDLTGRIAILGHIQWGLKPFLISVRTILGV